MADHPLDAIALAIEALVVGDRGAAVRLWRNDRLDPAVPEVVTNGIGIVGLVGDEGVRRLLRQRDQRIVALAVRRFAWREVEGDGPSSSITETVNFTGEPAPRAAKSSLLNPPFPPAAETWARTVVESMV
jgi:hypothetical protein